ncbi:PQQ-binding-like beta-propeller repeat protein [Nocardioides litoris]|uniref:outer membrane protein assembly factor BamB family protein n=1 Tax=Nocardioides litoris TaxID=1926648 RepID=UPI001476B107|nr:PQQ-binding-like beta-propeller repeat protein [Nocardioides litoris]
MRPLPLAALALVLAVTACSGPDGDDGPGPTPTTTTTSSAPVPPLPELALDDQVAPVVTEAGPVVTAKGVGLRGNLRAQVVGDLLAFSGTPRPDGSTSRTTVVDLRSGRPLWTRRDDEPLPSGAYPDPGVLTATERGPLVVSRYYADGCAYDCPAEPDEQTGVVAVDARTGRPVWGRGLTGARTTGGLRAATGDAVADPRSQLWAASPAVVVAEAGAREGLTDDDADASNPVALVGLDPATGRQRWTRPHLRFLAMVPRSPAGEELVLGRTQEDEAQLTALDARTGEVRWRGPEIATRYALTSVGPSTIVLDVANTPVLLDSRTGRELAQQLPEGTGLCARWVRGYLDVACAWRDPAGELDERLVTLGPDGELALSPVGVPEAGLRPLSPRLILGDLVAFDAIGEGPTVVVDRAGSIVRDNAPGELLDLTASYLVVQESDGLTGPEAIEVLRRR